MHPAVVEHKFQSRADKLRNWGAGLLVCAFLPWCYAVWQLFVPYESTYNKVDCPAPVNAEPRDVYYEDSSGRAHEDALQCASDRDWSQPLAAVVISMPLAVAGTVLLTAGTVSLRLRTHDEALLAAKSAKESKPPKD